MKSEILFKPGNRWRQRFLKAFLLVCLAGFVGLAFAQVWSRRRSAVSAGPIDRGGVPTWPLPERFEQDVFTFARLKYTSSRPERSSYAWFTDYPDADLNLSYRLQQLSSLRVHPEPKVLEIADPELFSFPWVFMSGAGNITLTDEEAATLRKYLLNGGAMMVDDFWGQREWDGVFLAMKKIFPDRQIVDVPRSHQIFHFLFDLPDSLSLQTSNLRSAVSNQGTGVTWEDNHLGGNTREIHFRAIFDDKDRIMVFLCHNTDNGDGWEEEGSDPWFFREFSEKKNYPLGFNIIFYLMTH